MELHQLRYFVATAEAGSASRAATRCRVAQPSLSLQLKRLEESLGAALFDRHGRGMALTDAGRALLPRAREILGAVRDAEENLASDVMRGLGRVSIGAIPTMAPYLLPRALRALRRRMPECETVIHEDLTDNLVELLLDHRIDCAIMSTPPPHAAAEIESVTLAEEELVVLAAADSPLSAGHIIGLADLRGRPIIALLEMHCLGRQIEGFCSAKGLAPQVICRTAQIQTITEMVALGLGVSIVPEMAVASGVGGSGRVSWARLRTPRPKRPIVAAWRRDRKHARAADRFIEIVRTNLARGAHSLPEEVRSSPAR